MLPSPLSPTWQGDSGLQKYCIHMIRLEAWGRKSVFLESLSSEKILPFYFYSFHVGLLSPFKIISWYVSTFICLPTFRFSLLFRREMISFSYLLRFGGGFFWYFCPFPHGAPSPWCILQSPLFLSSFAVSTGMYCGHLNTCMMCTPCA